jgi:hypothetical protein
MAGGISFTATGDTTKTKPLRSGKGSSQESVESDQPRTNSINPLRMKLNLLYLQI